MGKLTVKEIQNLKPKEKAYSLSDGEGLFILVKPDGRKLWEFSYISPTKYKKRKTSFNYFPKVSLKLARAKAKKHRDLILKGIDPIDQKREDREKEKEKKANKFEKIVKEWLTIRKKELAPRTYEKIEGLFLNFVLPPFRNKSIQDITRKELSRLIKIKAETSPETASRMYQYLNRLWLYAVNLEYCDRNILADIDRKALIPKRVVINYPKVTDLEILQELVNAIFTYTGHYSVRNLLKFALFIPLRPKNLIGLKWSYIDFEKQVLTIPRKEMKLNNPNLPAFQLPLTSSVIEILQDQKLLTGHQSYVFTTSTTEDIPINPETPNRALQRLGFNNADRGRRQRLHSFRGTFRSLAETYTNEHKASEAIKEIALDHRTGNTVRNAYANKAQYLEQLKPLMKWWSDFIVNLLEK